jgi:hypothetical protein
MKQAITQKDEYGCGAACHAFIANITYNEAAEILGCSKARECGFYCNDLVQALEKHELLYDYKHLKTNVPYNFPEGAIVFIKRSRQYPAGHWLVYHEERWMDSWINFAANHKLEDAQAGFRKSLPGEAQWMCYPMH